MQKCICEILICLFITISPPTFILTTVLGPIAFVDVSSKGSVTASVEGRAWTGGTCGEGMAWTGGTCSEGMAWTGESCSKGAGGSCGEGRAWIGGICGEGVAWTGGSCGEGRAWTGGICGEGAVLAGGTCDEGAVLSGGTCGWSGSGVERLCWTGSRVAWWWGWWDCNGTAQADADTVVGWPTWLRERVAIVT